MRYSSRRQFRYELGKILNRSHIAISPLREAFISQVWRRYNSQDRRIKLFSSSLEESKFNSIRKKMSKSMTWGSFLYFITDGNPKNLL